MRYKTEFEVSSHDIDINDNVRPSFILRYMQETANHQMRDKKPSYAEMFKMGKAFIITRINIEIYKQLHEYDHIEAATWRCEGKGATFIRCYEIKRGDDVIARAYSTWAVVNRETGKLCKTSEVDISHYETEDALELDIPKRFRLPKDADFRKVGEKEILYGDVDFNKHMNNTYYPDMLWNYIPGVMEKEVTSVNLRFMKEAHLGGKVDIYMAEGKGKPEGDDRAEECYMFYSSIDGETNVEAVFGMRKTEIF